MLVLAASFNGNLDVIEIKISYSNRVDAMVKRQQEKNK
jgi:hypothetical protein